MYYVVIEFDVISGREKDFVEHWSELTEAIHKEAGGLGSRLHKTSEGKFVAYAQWPDKSTRDNAPELSEHGQLARKRMHETIVPENTKVLLELYSVKDLLKEQT